VAQSRPVLLLLFGALALVLRIVCANVANLLLSRGDRSLQFVWRSELRARGSRGK
jgi:hypothetical protein